MANTLAATTKGTSIGIRKLRGRTVTINSQDIEVLDRDDTSTGYVRYCSGTVTITDGGAGYAVGCIYIKTNGTAGTVMYINEGSTSSCDFNPVETPTAVITGVTAQNGLVGGGTAGTITLDVAVTIFNNTGGALNPGELVRLSGYTGTSGITVTKADADSNIPATHVVIASINNSASGTVYPIGRVTNLNTNGRTIGDPVYLDSTTAGGFTFTAPTGANQLQQIVGVVKVVNATTGEIEFFPGLDLRMKLGTDFLQDSAVTNGKVANGAISPAKFAASESLTSTADGLTTGLMSGNTSHAIVTSASATNWITLPASAASLLGRTFTIWVGANGFELVTPSGSNATINGTDSDGTNQCDIPANSLSRLTLVNTDTWLLENIGSNGAVAAAITPDND